MEYVLKTFSLVKTYKDVNVVDNVSMNIPRGQIYGFVGRNGAGKTTLMRLVCGLITKSGGSFTLFGKEDEDRDIGRARRRMGATALIACALALLFAWGWYDWFGRVLEYFIGSGIGVPVTVFVTLAVQGLSPHAILMTAFGGYGGWALYIACGVVFAALCHCLCTVVLRRKEF